MTQDDTFNPFLDDEEDEEDIELPPVRAQKVQKESENERIDESESNSRKDNNDFDDENDLENYSNVQQDNYTEPDTDSIDDLFDDQYSENDNDNDFFDLDDVDELDNNKEQNDTQWNSEWDTDAQKGGSGGLPVSSPTDTPIEIADGTESDQGDLAALLDSLSQGIEDDELEDNDDSKIDFEPESNDTSNLNHEDDDGWGFLDDSDPESTMTSNEEPDDFDFESEFSTAVPQPISSIDIDDSDDENTFNPFADNPGDFESDEDNENVDTDSAPDDDEPEDKKPKQSFKEKINETIEKIKAELKGEDPINQPSAPIKKSTETGKSNTAEDLDDDGDDEDSNNPFTDEDSDKKPKGDDKNIFMKILSPYLFFTDFLMKVILKIVGIFVYIPIIGRIIKPLLKPNMFFRIIAALLPIVAVFFFLNHQGGTSTPETGSVTFPDGGHAIIKKLHYNEKKQVASGIIVNDGDVIADVIPKFSIYTMQRGINPVSWFKPQEANVCEGDLVSVQIEKTKKVKIKCPIEGKFNKMTGDMRW